MSENMIDNKQKSRYSLTKFLPLKNYILYIQVLLA
jgi:hypothetical protein